MHFDKKERCGIKDSRRNKWTSWECQGVGLRYPDLNVPRLPGLLCMHTHLDFVTKPIYKVSGVKK